jgi:hypothetical protein
MGNLALSIPQSSRSAQTTAMPHGAGAPYAAKLYILIYKMAVSWTGSIIISITNSAGLYSTSYSFTFSSSLCAGAYL